MNETSGESQVTTIVDPGREWFEGESLPKRVDVAIIGGGIVGCSAAYFLAKQGLSVCLLEKGRIAGEQSGRNWGWVRQQGRANAELPIMIRANQIWQQWQSEMDTGFEIGGCLYLANTQDELQEHEAWLEVAKQHSLATNIVSGTALDALLPGHGNKWAGALYTPNDGRAEPNRAALSVARAAVSRGAHVFERCAVRGLETQAGKVYRVVTEKGSINSSTVLCAAGAWTSMFARSLNINVPQLKIKGNVARTEATATGPTMGTAWAPDVAIRRRQDGGYTVAHGSALEHSLVPSSFRFGWRFAPAFQQERNAIKLRINSEFLEEFKQAKRWPLDQPTVFERQRILHPKPSVNMLDKTRRALDKNFPELKDARFVETWAGMIEASPDMIPIMGSVETLEGFYVATGFSGHGFGFGPGAGEAMADLITGNRSASSLQDFRLSRFFDGSKIELGPTV
ncbi:MAG: FAD-binding oxidoreductase [Pseudomonadota bacterium]